MGTKWKVKIFWGVLILPKVAKATYRSKCPKIAKKNRNRKICVLRHSLWSNWDSDSLSKVKQFKLVVRTSVCEKKIVDNEIMTRNCCQMAMSKNGLIHGLRTPGEEIAFTERPKIHSHSQIFRYGQSIFCLPLRPKFSDFFDRFMPSLGVRSPWFNCIRER